MGEIFDFTPSWRHEQQKLYDVRILKISHAFSKSKILSIFPRLVLGVMEKNKLASVKIPCLTGHGLFFNRNFK